MEKDIISLLRKVGHKSSEVEKLPTELAERKPEKGEDYYYYLGPLDKKTREFCSTILKLDKVFSKSQIDYISEELGYDVLVYCGSFNCRHNWIKFRGRVISTPPPTVGQIRKIINRGIEV